MAWYKSKIYHVTSQNTYVSLAVLMGNKNTVPVTIRNKQMSGVGDDSITRVAILKKTPSNPSDTLSIKSEKLQFSASRIAKDQTVQLVNNETNGFQELSVTRSIVANAI